MANGSSQSESALSFQEILNPTSKVSSLTTFAHLLWLKRYPILIVWALIGVPAAVFFAFIDIPHNYWTQSILRFPNVTGAENNLARDISITQTESIVSIFKSEKVLSRTVSENRLQFRIKTLNLFREDIF